MFAALRPRKTVVAVFTNYHGVFATSIRSWIWLFSRLVRSSAGRGRPVCSACLLLADQVRELGGNLRIQRLKTLVRIVGSLEITALEKGETEVRTRVRHPRHLLRCGNPTSKIV
jgi:hypothetical protein